MADNRSLRRFALRIAGAAFGVLLLWGFMTFVQTMLASKSGKPDRKVQIVQIMRPPPPPPPPPDQPPPPPEKTEQQLPKDQPPPQPEAQQQAPIETDQAVGAGNNDFNLAHGNGGGPVLGGAGSAPFAWYTNRISDVIREKLAAAPCAKSTKNALSVRVFMEADGRVKRINLSSTTGNAKVDACIDSTLGAITRMNDPVPPGMPEQVNLQIVPRI
jgi:protein TonB